MRDITLLESTRINLGTKNHNHGMTSNLGIDHHLTIDNSQLSMQQHLTLRPNHQIGDGEINKQIATSTKDLTKATKIY